MKYLKIFTVFVLVLLLTISPISAMAYTRKEHDNIMRDVLFKDFKVVANDSEADKKVEALECASYLSIDQYNGNGAKDLETLRKFGVNSLPKSIDDIDYSASSKHRRATHRGWDFNDYNEADQKRWKIRKQILINTADKILDSGMNSKKKDSFCAIIYYTHVLGDRIADDQYYSNAEIIELGGRTDKQDIIHELIKHTEILFADQKGTFKYNHVISKFELYNTRVASLLKKNNGDFSEKDFETYEKYANKVMDVMIYNYPEMLKEEKFFKAAFY